MTYDRSTAHQPVLCAEAIGALALRADGTYIDATFGAGGHSGLICEQLGPGGRLLGLDCDASVAVFAAQIDDPRFSFAHGNFAALAEICARLEIVSVDGVLMDLGVSSMQLADPERGFSFMSCGPLDMRMDQDSDSSPPLSEWLARVSEGELGRVLKELGEERRWRRLAGKIVAVRQAGRLDNTADLARLCLAAAGGRRTRIHPATRVFQALRLQVNQELDNLLAGLVAAAFMLKAGGRLVVISFHSLEDRIVKRFLRPLDGSQGLVQRCGRLQRATPDEQQRNPRARSARMRVGVKL